MNNTFELNNLRKDTDSFNGKFTKQSPVVEIFSAMVNGQELSKWGKRADKAVGYIKELNSRADNGDFGAIAELNTLRRFIIEPALMEEIKLLGVFGTYKALGFDETVEREVYTHVGEKSREQAANGDVVFPTIVKETYQVPTFLVSGGFEVDYRRAALGDMSKENEGMNRVRIDIRNRAALAVINKIYKAIVATEGVKYAAEDAGLTKTSLDRVLTSVRRFGKPTFTGDFALLSQVTPFAGYVGAINSNTITGISEKMMNEIAENGLLGMYNGTVLSEMPNAYNLNVITGTGDTKNFAPLLPAGLGFVIPTGVNSPIATWTRGGLTSFTGNDVKTGKIMTRFDLECAADISKGHEHEVGIIHDTNLSDLV
jgi:DNA-binding phage protein